MFGVKLPKSLGYMSANKGFTLIELMVTVAVLAIVLSLGVPSFNSLIINNRLTTQANALVASINLARSEAIKRGVQVRVAEESGHWETGWRVTVAGAGKGNRVLLRRQSSFEGKSTLSALRDDNSVKQVNFSPRGFLVGSAVTFELCNSGAPANRQKKLIISSSGRVKVLDSACS